MLFLLSKQNPNLSLYVVDSTEILIHFISTYVSVILDILIIILIIFYIQDDNCVYIKLYRKLQYYIRLFWSEKR